MTLLEKQQLFSQLAARLISKAYELGFEVTLGETWRPWWVASVYSSAAAKAALMLLRIRVEGKGSAGSVHPERLAIDLNLFRNGKYLTSTEDHRPLGEWWVKQHELCRWGGAFGDGNHYSIVHRGRR